MAGVPGMAGSRRPQHTTGSQALLSPQWCPVAWQFCMLLFSQQSQEQRVLQGNRCHLCGWVLLVSLGHMSC